MPQLSLNAATKVISGYILPEKRVVQSDQEDVSEEEDEEEERQPEFLDMNEMNSVSSGGQMFHFSVPASKEVDFIAGGIQYRVDGRFPLRDPWWLISCTVRQGQRKVFLKGFPSYSLRTDMTSEDGESIVSQFLTACDAQPDFVNMFMDWLPKDRHMDPGNVINALQEFETSKPEHKAIAEELKSCVIRSSAWKHVRVASMYPGIMKYLPTLLPAQFMAIINKEITKRPPETQESSNSTEPAQQQQNNTDVLAKLEELIKTDVWKLGFNYIMYKELDLVRCEAKLDAFKLCDLFNTIPELQRNALLLYTDVKDYCRITGSTYIQQDMLEEKMEHVLVWEAVHFLEELGVLKRERKKVILRNFFGYEKGIGECLKSLVDGKPWKIQLDVREVLSQAQRERLKAKACESDAKTSLPDPEHLADVQLGSSNVDHDGITLPCLSDSDSDSDQAIVDLDPDQVRAAEMMCDNPVTVISGKGGCGKTTVVSLVFKAAMQQQTSDMEEVLKACKDFQNDSRSGMMLDQSMEDDDGTESDGDDEKPIEVLLSAPTGRAASLLTKRTSFTAYTMHQVLWSFMNTKKDEFGEPKDWKFSKVRVLVVDEGSLVSVQILHSLLNMLTKHAQLQKFILLGDVRQLPSIDPGNTLYDLFEGLRAVHWAIEMRTNHRAESELIVRNAGLISEMGKKKWYSPLEFDAIINMADPSTIPSDKRFIFVQICGEDYNTGLWNAIKFLLEKGPGLKDHKTSQFVAFRRKDCQLINELCCTHYSSHVTKTHKNTLDFRVGDKVCCTKNGYVSEKDSVTQNDSLLGAAGASHHGSQSSRHTLEASFNATGSSRNISESQKNDKPEVKKERLCNGEIFFIKEDLIEEDMGQKPKKRRYLTLDDENGRIVTACFKDLQRECKLRHAWARTIHTFQGSEAETIVYVLGDCKGQNWQHVYTAVTRGQKRVYVVGKEVDIINAIKKRITTRKTRLCSLVKTAVTPPAPGAEETLTQSGISQSPVVTQNFGPSQSIPTLHTPSFSQAFCSTTRPSCVGHLYKTIEAPDTSLQDDMAFNQTYSWSPMYTCDESTTTQNENVSKLSDCVENAALGAISSSPIESSRSSKRLGLADDCTTPRKLAKQTTSEESPSCSTRMKLLSIASPSPKSHSRQLFSESSSQREKP